MSLFWNELGAGDGNRTHIISLEGWSSTTELHPQKILKKIWWRGEDSNLRRLSRQIYSLIPLAAREPLQTAGYYAKKICIRQEFFI